MRLVFVEWVDSRRGEGWTRLDELKVGQAITLCKSVGWLVSKDSSSITIAGNIGDNPEQCCGDLSIPKRAIIRIKNLQEPRFARRTRAHNNSQRSSRDTLHP
jgi:hypothetical protein